ncbi:MAG TPA: intradiol ring-cleavage dioxygenase [Candidatus Saccharimonadales bacterium]|jgi:protocatechuate 3,4-dioxygenase beta subunit|nr:intradiol ring-cleavage dioxygenase [Candidatus Saccharimonadales bacterium]
MRRPAEDDRPIGRILTRREILGLLGGSALVAACAPIGAPPFPSTTGVATASPVAAGSAAAAVLPSCVVRPALTEGPYFVDEKLNRSDIRADPSTNISKPGVPLALTFLVSRISGSACAALAGATVDVWHCDAQGVYSDATDPTFGSTKGTKFLRGYQTTDAQGIAKFTTIWPGWYQGRAVHVHFKIRTAAANGRVSDFTSQLFFDETMNDQIFAQAPYSQKGGAGRLRNEADGIFQGSGGKLTLAPTKLSEGYAATFDIGLAA